MFIATITAATFNILSGISSTCTTTAAASTRPDYTFRQSRLIQQPRHVWGVVPLHQIDQGLERPTGRQNCTQIIQSQKHQQNPRHQFIEETQLPRQNNRGKDQIRLGNFRGDALAVKNRNGSHRCKVHEEDIKGNFIHAHIIGIQKCLKHDSPQHPQEHGTAKDHVSQ